MLENIEEFLKLETDDIKNGNKKGKKIIEDAEKLEDLIFEKKIRKKLDKITSKLKSRYYRLKKDVKYSERTKLKSDWKKMAEKDLSNLTDEVMLFREFLNRHKNRIRRNFNDIKYGFDLQDLANSLRTSRIVDEITISKFFQLLHRMDDNEIKSKTEEFEEQLERISELLFILNKLETEESNIGRKEN